jgi:hypothetical protein
MLPNALDFLLKAQQFNGSWGYTPGGTGTLEPTVVVIFALQNISQASLSIKRAVEWILSFQNPDGGWGICPQDEESGWQTAWAVYGLNKFGVGKEEVARGVQWLLNVDVMQLGDADLLTAGEKVAQIDFSLRGWPWLTGESSWVEPTALTMLGIRGNAQFVDVGARIEEGVRYLVDRRCTGGGWNVGNPVMFDALLPARVTPTALALLALQEISSHEIVPGDIEALRKGMFDEGGTMALAWGLIALHALGEEDAEARAELFSMQGPDGSWDGNPYLTAIAWMALDGTV